MNDYRYRSCFERQIHISVVVRGSIKIMHSKKPEKSDFSVRSFMLFVMAEQDRYFH